MTTSHAVKRLLVFRCLLRCAFSRRGGSSLSEKGRWLILTNCNRLGFGTNHIGISILLKSCAGWNQATDNHVFLQPPQIIFTPVDGCFREHSRRFLERGRRDETIGGQRSLRNAEQDWFAERRFAILCQHAIILFLKHHFAHLATWQESRVAGILNPHLSQHLPNDNLDVLIVDRDPLQAIDVLHFIHEVFLQFIRSEHIQDVMWVGRPIHQGLTGPDPITFVNVDVFPLWNEIFLHIPHFVINEHLSLTFDEASIRDFTIDFAYDRLFFRLPRLEQLSNPGQTARNVFCFRCLARNLGKYISRIHRRTFFHKNVGTHRQQIPRHRRCATRHFCRLSPFILDRYARTQCGARMFDNDLPRQTGYLIELFLHCDAFHDVTVGDFPADFGKDRQRVRIPLNKLLTKLDAVAVFDLDFGAVDDRVFFALAAVVVHNRDLGIAVHDDPFAFLVPDGYAAVVHVGVLFRIEAHELHMPGMLGFEDGLLDHLTGRSTDMECPHGQLRAWLADRLRRDDTNGLPFLDQAPASQVTSIARLTDPSARLTG